MTRPPAVVTYMSYSGLGIVRSLGRAGVPVYALDPDPGQIGMNSRFCRKLACPSLETDEEAFVEFLVRLSESIGQKPVLFPTGDNTVACLSRHEERLGRHFVFTGPGRAVVDKVVTKDALYRTALEANVPCPTTYAPSSLQDAREISETIGYPCIIKPIRSNAWHQERMRAVVKGEQKVILATGPDELLASYEKIAACDPQIIISEVIPGDDSQLYYFVSYMSAEQEALGRFAGRKMRVYPIHFGSASYVESIYDAELERISVDFLKHLKYQGLSGIEFKRDPRDGRFKLIEFNARFGLWDVLAARCGVDLADIAYRDRIGERPFASNGYRRGVKWASIRLDTKAFLDYRKENGSISWLEWLKSLRGEKVWAVFVWDDMKPFLSSSLGFLFNRIGRFWKAIARCSPCSRRLSSIPREDVGASP